jgi:hypothetical protein
MSGGSPTKRGVYVRAGMGKCPPYRLLQSLTWTAPNRVRPFAMFVTDRRCYLDRAIFPGPIHQFDPISMVELRICPWRFRGGTLSVGVHRIRGDRRYVFYLAHDASTGSHELPQDD